MGCTVDTITISTEQQIGARQNIKNAGVEDQVQVHLLDYRNMPPSFEKAFDACISTEMLEVASHVSGPFVANLRTRLSV